MEYDISYLSGLFGDGRKVTVKSETGSTNIDLAEGIEAGTYAVGDIIIAESQSDGRGRHGKSFLSPKGGIYFSFCVGDVEYGLSTVICGVAVSRALEKLGPVPQIKWVNDILLDGKKVCGILAKAVGDGKRAVMGVGINLSVSDLPESIKETATALDCFLSEEIDRCALIFGIVTEYERLSEVNTKEGASAVIAEYEKRMMLKGKTVTVNEGHERFEVLGVASDGALAVRKTDGEIMSLSSGEVSVKQFD